MRSNKPPYKQFYKAHNQPNPNLKENDMNVNLPSQVRQALYILVTLTSPVVFYLNQQTVVNDFWFGLYSVVVSAVSVLAALNVSKGKK